MNYIIFSLNSLCAYQKGVFARLHPVYLRGVGADSDGKSAEWVDDISNAKVFLSEEWAWTYATEHWGNVFPRSAFGVLCVHDQALEMARYRKAADDSYLIPR